MYNVGTVQYNVIYCQSVHCEHLKCILDTMKIIVTSAYESEYVNKSIMIINGQRFSHTVRTRLSLLCLVRRKTIEKIAPDRRCNDSGITCVLYVSVEIGATCFH